LKGFELNERSTEVASEPPRPAGGFVGFVVAAGLSVPVNLAARALLSTVVPYELAIVLSHLVGMAVAFTLTRRFVFGASGRGVSAELGRFAAVNALSLAITWGVSVTLVRILFPAIGYRHFPELTGHFAGLCCAAVSSYLGHRYWSFARRPHRVAA